MTWKFILNHHHHVLSPAQISLTRSLHFCLSFIAFGRSSGLHPVSSHSCCMYVRAGRPAFAWPCVGVHRSTSLMSSSLLLQQCLVRLTCIVFVMEGWWPYSWCLVGCCRQDLFNIALNIFELIGHINKAVSIEVNEWYGEYTIYKRTSHTNPVIIYCIPFAIGNQVFLCIKWQVEFLAHEAIFSFFFYCLI